MSSVIRVTREFSFEMAHVLGDYDGPCRNVHGHSYRLFVTLIGIPVSDAGSPKNGMVIDFSDLKNIVLEKIVNRFDHSVVISSDFDREKKGMLAMLIELALIKARLFSFISLFLTCCAATGQYQLNFFNAYSTDFVKSIAVNGYLCPNSDAAGTLTRRARRKRAGFFDSEVRGFAAFELAEQEKAGLPDFHFI